MSLFKENDVWIESTPNPCILPVDIMVKAHSSRDITVYWAVNTLDMRQRSDQLTLGFHIVVEETDYQKTIVDVYTYQYSVAQYRVPAQLEPGHRYRVQVTVPVADPGFSKWGALFCRKWGGAHPVFR